MEIQEIPAYTPHRYIADNIASARVALQDARGILSQRPSLEAPPEVVEKAIDKARCAAEHLFDAGQVNEESEAVREALAAAEVIMNVVRGLENGQTGIDRTRSQAADLLLSVDHTLVSLERELHLSAKGRQHPR